MRRSCRYRRRRSHSLCRDVRGVGGCTLHRWGLCCTLEHWWAPPREAAATCVHLFSSSAFAAPGTSSRPVGPFLRPIHKEPLWKRAASWWIFSEKIFPAKILDGAKNLPGRHNLHIQWEQCRVHITNDTILAKGLQTISYICEWCRISNEDGISPHWYFEILSHLDHLAPPRTTLHHFAQLDVRS